MQLVYPVASGTDKALLGRKNTQKTRCAVLRIGPVKLVLLPEVAKLLESALRSDGE